MPENTDSLTTRDSRTKSDVLYSMIGSIIVKISRRQLNMRRKCTMFSSLSRRLMHSLISYAISVLSNSGSSRMPLRRSTPSEEGEREKCERER